MSKAGSRILSSVHKARAFARGEVSEGFTVHVPEEVEVKAIREKLGLSQEAFALRFGFSPGAVRDWEQGRRQPEQAARVLLLVIDEAPHIVERVLRNEVTKIVTPAEIVGAIQQEFGPLGKVFQYHTFQLDQLNGDEFISANRPGVYVFWNEQYGCIKVGKSERNAPKRALQHCRDNTRLKDGTIQMQNLANDEATQLLIFNLVDSSRLYWLRALEGFLELTLQPTIKSLKNG